MKLTAYAYVPTASIVYDTKTHKVSVANPHHLTFQPGPAADKDSWYEFHAELPRTAVFIVHGSIEQTEGRAGNYVAGHFKRYTDAFMAAKGLGTQGVPGTILIDSRTEPEFDSYGKWKESFDRSAAIAATRDSGPMEMHRVLELAPAAIGALDPEYAAYLALKAKFEPAAG